MASSRITRTMARFAHVNGGKASRCNGSANIWYPPHAITCPPSPQMFLYDEADVELADKFDTRKTAGGGAPLLADQSQLDIGDYLVEVQRFERVSKTVSPCMCGAGRLILNVECALTSPLHPAGPDPAPDRQGNQTGAAARGPLSRRRRSAGAPSGSPIRRAIPERCHRRRQRPAVGRMYAAHAGRELFRCHKYQRPARLRGQPANSSAI